jgi:anti-sigma factor RsiW
MAAENSNAELMTAYLDDALEAGEAESFEKYLQDSPEARQEVESLQKILSIVRELPDVEAPPDFYEKLAKKLRRRRANDEGAIGLVPLPIQVLSILIVMMIAATYLMLEIERESAQIEKDPSAAEAQEQAERQRATDQLQRD